MIRSRVLLRKKSLPALSNMSICQAPAPEVRLPEQPGYLYMHFCVYSWRPTGDQQLDKFLIYLAKHMEAFRATGRGREASSKKLWGRGCSHLGLVWATVP